MHHREDEAFWPPEGSATFEIGEHAIEAAAGDYLFGPRNIPHRYTVGPAGCRMLFVTTLLDVDCGAGRFARIAADRGAAVAGIDATEAFVEIARERVAVGDFRVGDMEDLPWPDDTFDVVTGFNSFSIAGDMVNALREAPGVARPGATLAMTVFGRRERCQSTSLLASLRTFIPPRPERSAGEEDAQGLHEEGALEARATSAGLIPREAGYPGFVETYRDLETHGAGLHGRAALRASRTRSRRNARSRVAPAGAGTASNLVRRLPARRRDPVPHRRSWVIRRPTPSGTEPALTDEDRVMGSLQNPVILDGCELALRTNSSAADLRDSSAARAVWATNTSKPHPQDVIASFIRHRPGSGETSAVERRPSAWILEHWAARWRCEAGEPAGRSGVAER